MIQEPDPSNDRLILPRATVEAVVRRCLQSKPKMQHVIVALLLEERGILDVARELNLSPRQVVALKETGLQRLRECDAWHTWWEDHGDG